MLMIEMDGLIHQLNDTRVDNTFMILHWKQTYKLSFQKEKMCSLSFQRKEVTHHEKPKTQLVISHNKNHKLSQELISTK